MREFIDSKGDVWQVRACDGEEGCTIVSRFLTKDPGVRQGQPDPVPCEEVHIPRDVVLHIAAALVSSPALAGVDDDE